MKKIQLIIICLFFIISELDAQEPQFKFHIAFEDATGTKDTVWFIWDSLATEGPAGGSSNDLDTIFGEVPITLSSSNFEVYINYSGSIYGKVMALPLYWSLAGFPIRAQNYVYPINMYWDTSLIFNNNLPFDINIATLDNEFFFFSNNDPNLHHQYSMMFEDSIQIEPFSWGSQDHFPIDFAIGYDPNYGVGIRKEKEATSITIYPNPVTSKLVIKHKNNYKEYLSVRLTDLMGNIIRQEIFSSNELNLDIMNLSQGFYFIEVFNNDFNYKEKIIKY